jgi:hypothetical protein
MTRRRQLPILTLLAAALFLRVLVPAGWMPTPAHGAFAIEPCPAADPQPMVMDGHADRTGKGHKDHLGGDACFSALQIAFAPVDQPPINLEPLVTAAPATDASPVTVRATGPPAPPPPSTGPPAIA